MIPGKTLRIVVMAAVAMLVASLPALAQIIPPSERPGRDRERFEPTNPPLSQPGGSPISLPGAVAPPGAENITLVLRGVRFVGGTVYRPEELEPLYADLVGRTITLAAVYDIAARVTAKYGSDGYVLSRALVPPQQLTPNGAVVTIQIVEGYIDRVEWPASLSAYRDFFSDYTAKIIADRPANVRTLERYLLLAGDLPGLRFSSSLKPSKTNEGAATLVVTLTEKPVDLYGRLDNRGTPQRGPKQWLLGANLNNMLHMNEALTLNWAGTTTTQELEYYAANWRQVLTSEGLVAFINSSYGWGHPDVPTLKDFDFKTRSLYVEAGFAQNIIRAR